MIEIKLASELENHSLTDVIEFCNGITPEVINKLNAEKVTIFLKDKKIAAALLLKSDKFAKTIQVFELMVHRDYRGTDVTQAVKSYLLELSKKNNLLAHISTSNLRSINFFFSLGFRAIKFHKGFYSRKGFYRGDAIEVALTLPDQSLYNKEYDVDNFYEILGGTNGHKQSNRDSSTEGKRIRLV